MSAQAAPTHIKEDKTMAKKKAEDTKKLNATATPAQEPEINEVDGEPIYHAQEEEGEYHE